MQHGAHARVVTFARGFSDGIRVATNGCMATKRELIEPHKGDKRYARRDDQGQFTSSQDSVGRSLIADRRRKAKTVAPKGQGDRGDRKR